MRKRENLTCLTHLTRLTHLPHLRYLSFLGFLGFPPKSDRDEGGGHNIIAP